MPELDRKIQAKIPGEDTGISIKKTMCDICTPLCHCGIDAYVKDGEVIKIEGTAGHPMNGGVLCTKGANNRAYIYREDRIKTPLRRTGERGGESFEPITWDEAYSKIAAKLLGAKRTYGANSMVFYSGYDKWYRFMLQRLAFDFGTINYGAESSTCFTANRMAWMTMTGKFARPDMPNAQLYLAWSSATHYSRFNVANNIDNFKRRGGKVIIVDPRITPAVQRCADLHLRVKPGTDGLLANCIAGLIIKKGLHDAEYIEKYVHGFEEYAQYVCSLDIAEVSRVTTVPRELIERAAEMIGTTKPMSVENSPGSLIHQTNGYQTARAVFALSVITGNYNNVGGNLPLDFTFCEQGAGFKTSDEQFAVETMPSGYENRVGAARFPVWGKLITQIQCTDLARQILEGEPYPLKCLVAHGMNYRMFPDSGYMRRAIEKLDFFVDIDLFMTDTARLADIVLPACSSFEREEFKVYPGGFARYYMPAIEPLGEAKNDARIIQELCARLGIEDEYLLSGYRKCIEHVIEGCGVTVDELIAADAPVKVPNMMKFTPRGYIEHGCATSSGKLELYSELIASCGAGLEPLPKYYPPSARPNEEFPFILLTGVRVANVIHTRLHGVSWARALRPYPAADISPEDAERLGISAGDKICLYNGHGEIEVRANPTAAVAAGQVFMFHGYSEADVSQLLDHNALDAYSGFPGYKSAVCGIRKVEEGESV
ncbi:MAG: molybdopterin-dependent oxidoreductase [Oscillospiraceae bacterium]|nr:molybdopterin-dependent oxidoreductase [Oscillospiraceae bacterium]